MATVKVPVLVQMVVEVPDDVNERWENGETEVYGELEKELSDRLNGRATNSKVVRSIQSVDRVKFIDVGEMNVDLQ